MLRININATEALRECCSYQAPAIILNAEGGLVCHARLTSLSSDSVTLDVISEEKIEPPFKRCCISFVYRGDTRAFYAAVREHRQNLPPQLPQLVFEIPLGLLETEARAAFRVPIGEKSELPVRVATKDALSWAVRPVDLSLTGILIEFTAAEDPDLPIGAETEVELRLRNEVVRLKGEVRRRDKHRYGLFFLEVASKHGIKAPKPLRNTVEALERSWLLLRVR
jgi:hypothetical protein